MDVLKASGFITTCCFVVTPVLACLPVSCRLTGRHPLNCEPPMDVLMASGFITPPSIHYVRNHGAVPKLAWESHTITINGLVEQQLTISMDELVAMPSVTIPVTLVCAGVYGVDIYV
jgi:nitrate reductase (NAD(P)H)